MPPREFTVCALMYGDNLPLAQRCLSRLDGAPHMEEVRIGLNAVSTATRNYVEDWGRQFSQQHGVPVYTYTPDRNTGKYPLMRRMFVSPLARYVMWFDDDSYFDHDATWWTNELLPALAGQDMIGQQWRLPVQGNQWEWIMQQPWYNRRVQKPRHFHFCQGAWWVIRSEILKQYDWPTRDLHHCGGDSMLGELLRHQNRVVGKFDSGVRINADELGQHSKATRRGIDQPVVGRYYRREDAVSYAHHDFSLSMERL